jgi:signal transduction histidine kinase
MRRMNKSLVMPNAAAADGDHGWLPGLPPPHVLRAYLIGCLPLLVVYMIATETDGDLSRGFDLASALSSAFRFIGPAFVLLLPVWDITGWLERHRVRVWLLLLAHGALAVVFAVLVQWSSYGLIWMLRGPEAATRALNGWFIWQAMFMMMMYWAAAGGFTAYRAVRRAQLQARAAAEAQALLARSELAALRSKLNPHFLFNTLHGIVTLVKKDAARAERALLLFSDLLRRLLDAERNDAQTLPLSEELAFTRDYLELERLRLAERLQVHWHIEPAAEGVEVPVLCVQPLVENAIKHAFNPRSEAGRLDITARVKGSELFIEVKDDGPGRSAAAADESAPSHGLGISTVARRLKLLHGERGTLRAGPGEGGGFVVGLTLPVSA